MNCGFEDCRILDELIEQYEDDWTAILQQYQTLRKPDGDAIADLAVNNFTEMRDRTADPMFLLQKKLKQDCTINFLTNGFQLIVKLHFHHK
jgi:kynurenine 3-monooxygenase